MGDFRGREMLHEPLRFLSAVLALKARFNFSVTSWIRSAERNKKVGGHPNSCHLYGLAVDVVLDDESQAALFLQACERLGLKAIRYQTHIHVQIQ